MGTDRRAGRDEGVERTDGGARGGESRKDRIVAMLQSPDVVFVYWDLSGPRSAEISSEIGAGFERVLRILDLSDGTSRSVPVSADAGGEYVAVEPGRTYGFELATRSGGRWRTICRTERLETPPAIRPDATRTMARAAGVPGLSVESTPFHLGSSRPGGPAVRRPV
ncbi:MAG: DUF4912 domain-containing protein [Planctomycetota bacterium]|jgi:hypothetical protein